MNLIDILPTDVARCYRSPNPDLFRPLEERVPAPFVRLVRSDEDYVKIVRRTHVHLLGLPLEETLRHGRWAAMASARRYVQSGRALLLATDVPPRVAEWGRALSTNLVRSFALSQRH